MWNKEYKIGGYHNYEEGKSVDLRSYSAIAIAMDANPGYSAIIEDIKKYYGKVQIVPRRGKLIGSVALVQIPDTDFYLRAHSVVHPNDNGSGTKKRGREIAVARAIWFLNWLKSLDDNVRTSILYNEWNDAWEQNNMNTATKEGMRDYKAMRKAASCVSNYSCEIVEKSFLYPMERRILGADKKTSVPK